MNDQHSLYSLRSSLDSKLNQRRAALTAMENETKKLEEAKENHTASQEAQSNLQNIAQEIQAGAQRQIARTVSQCLKAVFPAPTELRISFERKRGKTEAEFSYLREGRILNPRVDSGGVMSVASVALRLASLAISLPPGTKFLCLDEPFQGLSSRNLGKMGVLVETLSRDLGVQFLVATHNPQLCVGDVIELPDLAPRAARKEKDEQ